MNNDEENSKFNNYTFFGGIFATEVNVRIASDLLLLFIIPAFMWSFNSTYVSFSKEYFDKIWVKCYVLCG